MLATGPASGIGSGLLIYDPATRQLVFTPRFVPPGSAPPATEVLGPYGWERKAPPPHLAYMAYDPNAHRMVAQASTSQAIWWWTGTHWRMLESRTAVHLNRGTAPGMFTQSAPWVTDEAVSEIIAFGDTADTTPSSAHTSHPPNLFAWTHDAWYPIAARMRPVPVNPQYFTLAFDRSVGGVVAFGGGSGERTSTGGWVVGGNETWELVRSHHPVSDRFRP